MKVHLLQIDYGYDGIETVEIFSTRAKAMEYLFNPDNNLTGVITMITAWEVK